jgi:hypothetical protein
VAASRRQRPPACRLGPWLRLSASGSPLGRLRTRRRGCFASPATTSSSASRGCSGASSRGQIMASTARFQSSAPTVKLAGTAPPEMCEFRAWQGRCPARLQCLLGRESGDPRTAGCLPLLVTLRSDSDVGSDPSSCGRAVVGAVRWGWGQRRASVRLVDAGVVAYEIGCEQTHGVEQAGCFLTAVRARRIRLGVHAAAASCSGLQRDRRTSWAGADS